MDAYFVEIAIIPKRKVSKYMFYLISRIKEVTNNRPPAVFLENDLDLKEDLLSDDLFPGKSEIPFLIKNTKIKNAI